MNNLNKKHSFEDANQKIEIKSIKVKHGTIESICYIINKKWINS